MPNQQNEAIVRRVLQMLSQPQLPADVDQTIDANWEGHAPMPFPRGPQGFSHLHGIWHGGFSDFSMTPEIVFSDGDYVAAHFLIRGKHTGDFMGFQATQKTVNINGVGIYRCQNGKLVEAWVNPNVMGALQQIGAIPMPGQPRAAAA
ncbi:MAG: ester cyclase [Chloroflexota bacterium]